MRSYHPMSSHKIYYKMSKNSHIIIVGAGVFGLSTALELASRGYTKITVLDRHLPPVQDGSSVDISRVIRSDYGDSTYAKMALEAYHSWKTDFAAYFHDAPFMMLTSRSESPYVKETMGTLKSLNLPFQELQNPGQIRRHVSDFTGGHLYHGYINPSGGWADAEAAVACLARRCSAHGVCFVTGPGGTVTSLNVLEQRVTGVTVATRDVLSTRHVIMATGAWTAGMVDMDKSVTATAQPVGVIQLTPGEADSIGKRPICIDMDTGFFCFPPTRDHLLKVARHGFGYENPVESPQTSRRVSEPRRDSKGRKAEFLPEDAELAMRSGLKLLLPEFAARPWLRTQLCWYSDTPTGDFIMDHHPEVRGLFVATGGSGQ